MVLQVLTKIGKSVGFAWTLMHFCTASSGSASAVRQILRFLLFLSKTLTVYFHVIDEINDKRLHHLRLSWFVRNLSWTCDCVFPVFTCRNLVIYEQQEQTSFSLFYILDQLMQEMFLLGIEKPLVSPFLMVNKGIIFMFAIPSASSIR